ncbi:hypothetical protein [Cerasicoccus frondis]|uniref:hypothetical protein n=1 Tax=Cerasicoccus frondis TaxID=490090 RepID=UPI002852A62A|nr:hypothetical protein [Cerasicoccus frondis]
MKNILLLVALGFALIGCESTEDNYHVQGNTVIGEGVGLEGFSFEVPTGYKVYQEGVVARTDLINAADQITDNFYGGGYAPYKIILFSDYEVLVLTPLSFSARPGYRRISDMHFQAMPNSFSLMNREDKIALLQNMVSSVSVHGENFKDVQTYVDTEGEIPVSVFSCNMDISPTVYLPVSCVDRLGDLREIYSIYSIADPMSFEKGRDDSIKLARSINLDPPAGK